MEKKKISDWLINLSEERVDYVMYYIEALASAYRTVVISYNHLTTFYERVIEQPEVAMSVYSAALASAWMFIDSYGLFSKLLYKCPFKLMDDMFFNEFNIISKPVRDCRDCHYHLEAENRYKEGKDSYVMGNLSWINEQGECVIVLPTYHLRKELSTGIIFDSISNEFTARLCLMFNGKQINFDYYYEQIQHIKDELVSFLHDDMVSKVFNDLSYSPISVKYVRESENKI